MKVAIIKDDTLDYCREAPFHPGRPHPEYPFTDTCKDNRIYDRIRDIFYQLGMDRDNYDRWDWNPLGEVVKPGNMVTIKPNFVGHFNPLDSIEAMITQGCIIRAVLDYVYLALDGDGSITIADAPSIDTDFGQVLKITGIDRVAEYYAANAGIPLNIVDMRKETGHMKMGKLVHEKLKGDPLGYSVVDLKGDSAHAEIIGEYEKFRSLNYSKEVMVQHHNKDKNEYCIGNSILAADVVINLPKLKTHNKTGMTCALKNLIGINGYKDWLPHHRAGSGETGGDEYERKDLRKDLSVMLRDEVPTTDSMLLAVPLKALSKALHYSKFALPFHDPYYSGCWHGNDTLPRTIYDLNRIIFYAGKDGVMNNTVQRKMFVLVDGVISGEKEGPQAPTAKRCGMLIAGHDPVEVDLVCSRIMGFDYLKMPMFKYPMSGGKYGLFQNGLDGIRIVSDKCRDLDGVYDAYDCHFIPSNGWLGHVELIKSKASERLVMPEAEIASTHRGIV
jgi:uncharacterized protein (DUF362 family)